MIEGAQIESDERGLVLELVGDFSEAIALYENDRTCKLRIRLDQSSALELLERCEAVIGPWRSEMKYERAAYDRASEQERAEVIGGTRS